MGGNNYSQNCALRSKLVSLCLAAALHQKIDRITTSLSIIHYKRTTKYTLQVVSSGPGSNAPTSKLHSRERSLSSTLILTGEKYKCRARNRKANRLCKSTCEWAFGLYGVSLSLVHCILFLAGDKAESAAQSAILKTWLVFGAPWLMTLMGCASLMVSGKVLELFESLLNVSRAFVVSHYLSEFVRGGEVIVCLGDSFTHKTTFIILSPYTRADPF